MAKSVFYTKFKYFEIAVSGFLISPVSPGFLTWGRVKIIKGIRLGISYQPWPINGDIL